MAILKASDFVGRYSLAKSTETNIVIDDYIEKCESVFIYKILGVELGKLYLSDPVEPRFVLITEPFAFQNDGTCGCDRLIMQSRGMKTILKALIYCEYVFNTQTKQGQGGTTINKAETGNELSAANAARTGEKKWNEALEWIEAIQWYCSVKEKDTYPEFKGTRFETKYSSFL